MLRMISENIQLDNNQLRGINFSTPGKRLQLTTLAQWQLSDSAPKERPSKSASEIRYPARLPMELPWSIDDKINQGQFLCKWPLTLIV